MEKITLADMLGRIRDLKDRASYIEDEMARCAIGNSDVNLLMTIPRINLYSATAIMAKIGDIKRFPDAEHLPSYTGLVPRVDQSGENAIYGHITKSGPSLLRYFIVNSVHTLIKLSPTFKKYTENSKRGWEGTWR